MSLFPAYKDVPGSSVAETTKELNYEAKSWLTNSSFISFESPTLEKPAGSPTLENPPESVFDAYLISSDSNTEGDELRIPQKRRHAKRSKNEKKRKIRSNSPEPVNEFTGDEQYFVDKTPGRGYLSVSKLYRPACPRYRVTLRMLGSCHKSGHEVPKKRYFKKAKSQQKSDELPSMNETISEEEFTKKTKEFNKMLAQNPKNVDAWTEYVLHQDKMPMKMSKTQMAEKKIEIIEKALIHNSGNEKLYKLYVDIIDAAYPSFEVSKMLNKLIEKDPTNYILWNAQIYATQGSMARCIVPDVLKLYEECMQKMYRKSQEDEIMLKLFTNCALFLRQSGLSEQFFALIKLALELNISVDKFNKIQPSEKDQQTLVEYEEVILKSGLPMNEIWLRIEKLRQNFNFLPCPSSSNCSDPQRIVFNEDICYFIFPLSNRENCFSLIVIILRLLKVPFLSTSSLRNRFLFKSENLNEFDSIEDILAVCLHQTTSLFVDSLNFDIILYELVKDMISGPSFLSANIGYEIYLNTILDILLLCSECFEDDERKRTIFVLLWLKFERILLIIEKLSSKLSNENIKHVKSKIKNRLKREENRNVLNFYTEYALIECELGNLHVAENIFITSISGGSSQVPKSDFCYAYVTYAEVLLKQRNYTKALKVLTFLALDISLEELNDEVREVSEPRKLLSLKKLTERLNDLIFIEKNVQIMELEQYFLPDYLISLLKAKIYYQILLKSKLEAIAYLDNLLRHFVEKNARHTFIRENIYELYLKIMQWADKTCFISNLLVFETVSRALEEFPDNLFMLKTCATLDGQPWYKIRRVLMKKSSPIAIVFLISSAQYRVSKNKISPPNENKFITLSSRIDSIESAYTQRVANLLREAIDKKYYLRRNSLIWRLYLRSLCDVQASFEKSKNVLFSALDECPWNKALYLDGSIFVPQECPQIQDLIIEKQLRLYALPEELEILRNDSFDVPK